MSLEDWPLQIWTALQNTSNKDQAELDAIIDSGGGDIFGKTGRILKAGGRVVCYGMRVSTNQSGDGDLDMALQDGLPQNYIHNAGGASESKTYW